MSLVPDDWTPTPRGLTGEDGQHLGLWFFDECLEMCNEVCNA